MDLTEQKILQSMRKLTRRPMKFSELISALSVPESQRREFRGVVKDMVAGGSLVKLRGGRYGLPDEMNLVSGTLQGHPDGFGFLVTDELPQDIYIGRKKMNGAMHKDRVLVRVENQKPGMSRPEGRVIRILERETTSLVGVYEPLGREGWVIPSEEKCFHDIFIPSKFRKGAKHGQVVCVEIEEYPSRHHPPVGKVVQVLGASDDPLVELRSIFHKFGIHQDFPPKVLEQAQRVASKISNAERKKRTDLTEELLFTIDGERAKDFDDAVSLETTEEGYRLGVHIADVSHYVLENSGLDTEAYERGTSIYYPDGVIPMLPEILSNEICSLKPDVERLAMSVWIDFSKEGEVQGYQVFDSVIKSRHRLTYNQVAEWLEKKKADPNYESIFPTLQEMHKLSRILRKKRIQQGSLEFQIPEPEISMSPEGTVKNISIAPRNDAHELIEEFMLSANQVVARYLQGKHVPQVHRIHEPPDPEKIHAFNEYLSDLGYKLPARENITSTHLQRLMKKVEGKPEERAINTLLLRAMKKAVYSEKPVGHFALGFEHYAHFTSPIRRYPDLAVHRLIKMFFNKKKATKKESGQILPVVAQIAQQSSEREQKAQEVEREVNALRRAQFMADKVGMVCSGIISGVQAFGFFVELQEVFVEGLVRVSNLTDDYYIFYEAEHVLKGQHRNRTFRMGDTVQVRVGSVDIARRRIDLLLAQEKKRR